MIPRNHLGSFYSSAVLFKIVQNQLQRDLSRSEKLFFPAINTRRRRGSGFLILLQRSTGEETREAPDVSFFSFSFPVFHGPSVARQFFDGGAFGDAVLVEGFACRTRAIPRNRAFETVVEETRWKPYYPEQSIRLSSIQCFAGWQSSSESYVDVDGDEEIGSGW